MALILLSLTPWVDPEIIQKRHHIDVLKEPPKGKKYSHIIAAVAHSAFVDYHVEYWDSLVNADSILFDFKCIIPRRLNPWRL